jgi:UDP-N-acetylglucosamine acyltransferase
MNKVYVGHDGEIGDGVVVASSVTMGGHVSVGDNANLGLGAIVHQRRVIGPGVMLGMGSVVTRDVPPFAKSFGNPARVQGVNTVGMTRQGLDVADAERLAELYAAGTALSVDWPAPDALRPALDWWWARASAA